MSVKPAPQPTMPLRPRWAHRALGVEQNWPQKGGLRSKLSLLKPLIQTLGERGNLKMRLRLLQFFPSVFWWRGSILSLAVGAQHVKLSTLSWQSRVQWFQDVLCIQVDESRGIPLHRALALLTPGKTTHLQNSKELLPSACSFPLHDESRNNCIFVEKQLGNFTKWIKYQVAVYFHKKVFTRWAILWNEARGRRGFFTFLVSQAAEPSFRAGLAPELGIVWKSHFQSSTARMSLASAGHGAADSCTHQTPLPHYITPLLKPFYWLSVMRQIYFKVCRPYTAWNGFTCTLNTA